MAVKTFWSSMRNAVNSFKDGEEITRKQILQMIQNDFDEKISKTSFDIYRLLITHIKILEPVKRGTYKKIQNFPESLTAGKAHKLESQMKWSPSWKDWFAKDLEERLKML